MKTEELTAIGLSEEQATQVLAMNGKDIEKHKKSVTDLTAERDDLKTQLETANKTIEGFGGKTPEDVQKEIDKYKQESEEAGKRYQSQILARDQKDWLNAQYEKLGVSSPFVRSALTAEIMAENSGLVWKDGGYVGFDDHMKKAKEKDNSIYLTEEEKAAQGNGGSAGSGPAIVGPTGKNKTDGGKKYVPPKVF